MDNTSVTEDKRKPYSPNRSCERCRALKIRCAPEDSTKCQRCARLRLDCVYALPAKRKPRKRTDAKVAELEKQVRALSSIIQKQHNAPSISNSVSDHAAEPSDWSPMATSEKISSSPEGLPSGTNAPQAIKAPLNDPSAEFDAVEAGIVTNELAKRIFYVFRDRFIPSFPLVAFPPNTTPEQVQMSRPFLYQAILAAACNHVDPSLGPILNKRIMSAIAEHGMVKGVKSLDLLQAILVTTCWHYPETSFEHLKYHQYAHLAAGMASYVGIERKSIIKDRKALPQQQSHNLFTSDNTTLSDEERNYDLLNRQRTLLACFLLCSGVCRSLHRPTILPFTNWMAQCLDNLQNSPFAAPSDPVLASWVRLQKLMTESSTALGLDDDDVFVDLSEPRVQRALAFYDFELKSWREGLSSSNISVTLNYIYHASRVGLHEVVMYLDHEQEDLHPPFSLEKIGRPADRKKEPTIAHVETLATCWYAAVDAIEAFLVNPIEVLQCSPFYFFVRMIYSVTVLIKLCESASIPGFASPSDIGNREAVALLISRLIRHMKAVEIGDVSPVASRVVSGLERMMNWLNRPKESSAEKKLTDDLLEPLMYLALQKPSEERDESEDVCFDNTESVRDNVISKQDSAPQQGTGIAVPELSHTEIDHQSFMNWEEFDWNFVSPPGFDFPLDLTLFDIDNLTFGSNTGQDAERII